MAQALDSAGLGEHFEVVVDSKLAGVEKPDPRIFSFAIEALGLRPDEVLYIGDIYEVDVVGAEAAGLHAALVDPERRHAGHDVLSAPSVAELIDLLARRGELSLQPGPAA